MACLEAKIQAISGISFREWVEIKATLQSIEDDRFNCAKCLSRYDGRPDGEVMLAKVRANMGCQEMKGAAIHKIPSGLSFRTCVGNFVRPGLYPLISAHRRFQQGVMPYAGGLMDQPAKLIDLFGVIDTHQAERAERERQAEQRKGGLGVGR
jgi:hypothetical protein